MVTANGTKSIVLEIYEFFNIWRKSAYGKKPITVETYRTDKEVIIHTLEGDMKAEIGDWIITGVNGEQYPCKPDIFNKRYDIIKED